MRKFFLAGLAAKHDEKHAAPSRKLQWPPTKFISNARKAVVFFKAQAFLPFSGARPADKTWRHSAFYMKNDNK